MFKSGVINPQTIEPYVKKLAERFQNDGKQGFFVLRWTPQSQTELKDEMKDVKRETYFYEDLQYVSYQKTKASTPQVDKLEQEIDKQIDPEAKEKSEATGEEKTVDADAAPVDDKDKSAESKPVDAPPAEVKDKLVDTPPVDSKEGEGDEVKYKSVDVPPAEVKGEKSEATGEEKTKHVDATPADDEDEDEDYWNDQERYDYENNVEFEEEPIDPWVKKKLNYLKKKGLI